MITEQLFNTESETKTKRNQFSSDFRTATIIFCYSLPKVESKPGESCVVSAKACGFERGEQRQSYSSE